MGNTKPRKRLCRSPLRAIRAKCLECCGGSHKEVRLCPDATCALHPFRKGQNPYPRPRKSAPEGRGPSPRNKGGREFQLSLLDSLALPGPLSPDS